MLKSLRSLSEKDYHDEECHRQTTWVCQLMGYIMSGWWFGTWLLFFHILGISSSQLTNSIIFQRGRLNHQLDVISWKTPDSRYEVMPLSFEKGEVLPHLPCFIELQNTSEYTLKTTVSLLVNQFS
jgi:hypothetical protein